MKLHFLVILLFCSLIGTLSGCGQSGHLYLPQPDTTTPGK
ncbi:MAG: lipoprotein [Pseudomonadota bacterium]